MIETTGEEESIWLTDPHLRDSEPEGGERKETLTPVFLLGTIVPLVPGIDASAKGQRFHAGSQ